MLPIPTSFDALAAEQERLAGCSPPLWRPGSGPIVAGGCFVAFARGEQGPGRAGDHAWVAAALVRAGVLLAEVVVRGEAGASYEPGLLAAREGPMLAAAVDALPTRPDVLLVDATGRDHPRGAGLALHLGAVLDVPSVGVTHRPLAATGPEPGPERGNSAPLLLDGDEVARWVRTRTGVRAVVAHAGWCTDVATAVEVVLRVDGPARSPEPLRQARRAAREARSRAQGPRR